MLGKRIPEFLDRINGVFICLILTVIHQVLSEFLEKGIYEPKQVFAFDSAKGMLRPLIRLF
jgi:hypothetical protein